MDKLDKLDISKNSEILCDLTCFGYQYKLIYEKASTKTDNLDQNYRFIYYKESFLVKDIKSGEFVLFFHKPKRALYLNLNKEQKPIFSTLQIDDYMKSNDLRVIKTKKAMFDALNELMKEKTFEEIQAEEDAKKAAEAEKRKAETKKNTWMFVIAIGIAAVLICGGYYYFKFYKPRKEEEDAESEHLEDGRRNGDDGDPEFEDDEPTVEDDTVYDDDEQTADDDTYYSDSGAEDSEAASGGTSINDTANGNMADEGSDNSKEAPEDIRTHGNYRDIDLEEDF